ncbi:MAG: zinc metallopeptidase [Thermodesulfobacteriota bacterium]|nr:zinc metallopeptidase [Thermodesulfobacteriota bacterium]
MFFDPLYLLFMGPALLLSIAAQIKVKSTFNKFSKIPSLRAYSGARAAKEILGTHGLHDVQIKLSEGFLSDHYNPTSKVLGLSNDVYQNNSLSSIGVAAHEAGHALQHADGYTPMRLRSTLVPMATLGSNLSWPLLIIGFIFSSAAMIHLGIIFFSAAVLFQIVTLPVEFNASKRALAALTDTGILQGEEIFGARKVLSAAAMTYVAAAAVSVMQLIYFLLRSGILGGGSDD